jgi:hypothetical protein
LALRREPLGALELEKRANGGDASALIRMTEIGTLSYGLLL